MQVGGLPGSRKGAAFRYVGDSILGADVNLGASVRLANLKMLPGTAAIWLADGTSVDTAMPKLGAVIGDRTQIGCNAVTSPGTVVGPDCVVYATVSLQGCVPPGSIVSWRPELKVRPRHGSLS